MNSQKSTKAPMSRRRRIAYNGLGILCTGIGVVGIVTPVLPTTIFFILASGLFVRSNPVLHRWLHKNRVTGAYLKAYTQGGGLSLRRKLSTIAVLWIGLGISAWFVREITWLLVLLAAIGIAITIHVATVKPRRGRQEAEERSLEQESQTPPPEADISDAAY